MPNKSAMTIVKSLVSQRFYTGVQLIGYHMFEWLSNFFHDVEFMLPVTGSDFEKTYCPSQL